MGCHRGPATHLLWSLGWPPPTTPAGCPSAPSNCVMGLRIMGFFCVPLGSVSCRSPYPVLLTFRLAPETLNGHRSLCAYNGQWGTMRLHSTLLRRRLHRHQTARAWRAGPERMLITINYNTEQLETIRSPEYGVEPGIFINVELIFTRDHGDIGTKHPDPWQHNGTATTTTSSSYCTPPPPPTSTKVQRI